MHKALTWRCDCGEVEFTVTKGKSSHAVCYCTYCRANALLLDHANILNDEGGVSLLQVAPEMVTAEKGKDRLAVMTLSARGPMRWYTSCCNTPLANTLATPGIPFVSISAANLSPQDGIGPVTARVFTESATRGSPRKYGQVALIAGFAARALKSRLNGGWKRNPFFDASGKPLAQPRRVSSAEMEAAGSH